MFQCSWSWLEAKTECSSYPTCCARGTALCILGMICIQAVRLDRFLLTRQSSPFMSPPKPLFRLPCSLTEQPSIGGCSTSSTMCLFSKASQKIWEIAIDLCARGVGSLVPPNKVQISTQHRDLTKSKCIAAYSIPCGCLCKVGGTVRV